MPKFRKKPVVIEAHQWHRNGDHPKDRPCLMHDREARDYFKNGDVEGMLVRWYDRSKPDAGDSCKKCGRLMSEHGWLNTLEGGSDGAQVVCPGDWIITGVHGEYYPCKPDIFEETYEPVPETP